MVTLSEKYTCFNRLLIFSLRVTLYIVLKYIMISRHACSIQETLVLDEIGPDGGK